MEPSPDLMKFRSWLRANEIGVTKGYELVKNGQLSILKIGRASYISRDAREKFLSAVLKQPQAGEGA